MIFFASLLLQLNHEFARMMERDIQDECVEIWYSLVPKILSLAEDNETAGLAEYLEAYTCDEVSDGKCETLYIK